MSGVLLIDDAAGFADLIRAMLDDTTVRQVSNLSEAVQVGGEIQPDVILLDLNLGEEDGLDFFRRRSEIAALSGVPVIVFTVHDSRFGEAVDAGAVACLRKPFKAKELFAVLGPYLDQDPQRVG